MGGSRAGDSLTHCRRWAKIRRDRLRAQCEQHRRIGVGEQLYRIALLGVQPQGLSARDQERQVRCAPKQGRDRVGGVEDLLEVVEQDQHVLVRDVGDQVVIRA